VQSAFSPLTVAEHMLEQNDTSEWMHVLIDAIVEPKDNSKAFLQTIHECPKGQPIDPGYPAHTQFRFFARRIIFQNNGSLFLLGGCLCVSLPSTIEGSFFQYRARLRSTPYACKRLWEAQTKNIV
jgi:hypothetical protein